MGAGEKHLRGIDTLFQKVVGFGNLAVCPVQLTGNGFQGGLERSDLSKGAGAFLSDFACQMLVPLFQRRQNDVLYKRKIRGYGRAGGVRANESIRAIAAIWPAHHIPTAGFTFEEASQWILLGKGLGTWTAGVHLKQGLRTVENLLGYKGFMEPAMEGILFVDRAADLDLTGLQVLDGLAPPPSDPPGVGVVSQHIGNAGICPVSAAGGREGSAFPFFF